MVETGVQKRERYTKKQRIKQYEQERHDDSVQSEPKDRAAAEKLREESTKLATKMAEGEKLTKADLKKLEKSPGIRIFVRRELQARGLDTGEMYAEMLHDGFRASQGENPDGSEAVDYSKDGLPISMSQADRTRNRALTLGHISDMEGIKKQAQKEEQVDPIINLIVDSGLCLKIDQNARNIEIHPGPPPSDITTPDEAQSSHQDSNLWSKGGEDNSSSG